MSSSLSSGWEEISDSSPQTDILDSVPHGTYITYLVEEFCHSLQHSKAAPSIKIFSCTRYGGALYHRCLILQCVSDRRHDLYIRLDRRPGGSRWGLLINEGTAPAKDTVRVY